VKKLSLNAFVHLKATYWKEKDKHVKDLNFILTFLRQFNPEIQKEVTMNNFSEINDPNILIQDGPLACYCSHLRAMIYGYLNFKDYTIIVEDDLFVSNTQYIEKYIACIPEDWDIICLNSGPINTTYADPYYKFTNTFHSLHFYIINNKCYEKLFKHMYPIVDQVDILIANLYDKLNIYNITDTVYQKNFSTNTQNNLYVILNSPNYEFVRIKINKLKTELNNYVHNRLQNNVISVNEQISSNILFDVVYNYIINNLNYENVKVVDDEYINTEEIDNIAGDLKQIYELLYIIVNCCVKGININNKTRKLIDDINNILDCYQSHNKNDIEFNETIKAYSYGSTSNTYLLKSNNVIVKVYNDKLRWTAKNHDNLIDIFESELTILKRLVGVPRTSQLLSYDEDALTIKSTYMGESLYNQFILPPDWKVQIEGLFDILSRQDISYPEFNLKNIVVLDGTISFIDFGLAAFAEECDNKNNKYVFVELLDILDSKFSNVTDTEQRQILYHTLINNIKIEGADKYSRNIF